MTPDVIWYVAAAIAVAIFGAIGGLLTLPATLRKLRVDTNKITSDADQGEALAYAALLDKDNARYTLLWARLDEVERKATVAAGRAEALSDHVNVLEDLMRAAGLTIPPRPPNT